MQEKGTQRSPRRPIPHGSVDTKEAAPSFQDAVSAANAICRKHGLKGSPVALAKIARMILSCDAALRRNHTERDIS